MKKTLLLGAVVLMASTAMAQVSEPTLTLDWSYSADKLPTDANARWAAGYNGTLYIPWTTNKGLVCLNSEGKTEIETGTTAWCITADEAGNLLIQTSGYNNNVWSILPAGKTSKNDLINLTMTFPDNCATGRTDMVGRAIGNVMSAEGGTFYSLGSGQTKITKFFIANGEQVTDKTKAIELGKNVSGNAQSIAQPTNSDINAIDNVVWTIRSTANQLHKLDGTAYTEYALNTSSAGSATGGGDIITLSGVTYTIEPCGVDYSEGFIIVDRTNDKVIYTKEGTTKCPFPASWGSAPAVTQEYVSFEKTSETTANVYQFMAGVYAAKYTFTVPCIDDPTAIEVVEVENAPVEYYNLQGVKVENPSNGLFIKKQGTKTTKVVL